MKNLLFLFLLYFTSMSHAQTNYYVDNIDGDDTNTGIGEATAFKSLEKINAQVFFPGDSIFFIKGGSWIGTLKPKGNGIAGSRILIGSYGEGNLPIIDAEGQKDVDDLMSASIIFFNQEYWEIRDLEVRNFEKGDPSEPSIKAGILVLAKDIGTLHDFKFENLKISHVNGSLETRTNGGLFFNVIADDLEGNRIPTNFDGIYVNNCHFLDVDRGGFINQSFWKKRDMTSQFGEVCIDGKVNSWYPSHNILIENSKFENVGGNGLVTRVADTPIVQYNLFERCGSKTTGNASYPYNCDNALWQYNEACYTVYNDGDADASGFDSDYMCKNTIIQYNYSHHNDWGGILVCSWGSIENSFNDGTIVQNNVFQDEKHHMIRFSGNITNTEISNNLFVTSAEIDDVMMWYKSWGYKWPDNTVIKGNVFYNDGTNNFLNLGSTSNNTFSGNILFGSEFTDFTDFVPSLGEDEENLNSKIQRVREIGERSEFSISEAEKVIDIVWAEGSAIIDIPAINKVSVIDDSYIRGDEYSAENFNGTLMEIKESSTNNLNFVRRVWLKFDLSDYNEISSAILHISGNQSNGVAFDINVSGSDDDAWGEESITWDNVPAVHTLIGTFSTPGDIDDTFQDFHIDVTSFIQNQLAGDKIVSMNLWAVESSSHAFKISDKEGLGTAAYLSVVETTLGNQKEIESIFNMYPNPVQDSFEIQSPKYEINKVKIYSINGSLLFTSNNVSSYRITIDTSVFKTGVYFVYITNTQGALCVKKIIKT